MSILFGQLAPGGGGLYFDQLDEPLGTIYLQTNEAAVTLSDASTFEYVPAYEMALECEFDVYDASYMEHLPPPAAPSYVQSNQAVVTILSEGTMEHISPQVVHTMSLPAEVALSDAGSFEYFPGTSGGTEYIQSNPAVVTLLAQGTQSYTSAVGIVQDNFTIAVDKFLADLPSEREIDFTSIDDLTRLTVRMSSTDPAWVINTGPTGGELRVNVEVIPQAGDAIPLASLSSDYPELQVIELQADLFAEVKAALAAGPVSLRFGGFEALSDRVIPVPLTGLASVSAEALSR